MNYIKKIIMLIICIAAVMLFSHTYYAEETNKYADITYSSHDAIGGDISDTTMKFQNNDTFVISKISPYSDNSYVENSIFIPGENIKISFFDSQQNFVTQTNIENLPKKTLYISTNKCDCVISISAVHSIDIKYKTIVPVTSKEEPLKVQAVTYPEPGYIFTGNFNLDISESGEMWYLLSENKNTLFYDPEHEFTITSLKINELSSPEIRLCHDGLYFKAPISYEPYTEGMLYKQPSCYTGVSFSRYGSYPVLNELGYAIMFLSAQNQNDDGYFPTTLSADWLKIDFNIGENFYDTRFNTDFATGLCTTYNKFKDDYFLSVLFKYSDFFINYTNNNHYKTQTGWLISDYGGNLYSKQTHSSLNHHTAEIIYLNHLYDLLVGLDDETKEKFKEYDFVYDPEIISELSEKMLNGIKDTENYWIMPDNNLVYAYNYKGTANVMVDYPYLTYNDLFTLNKQIRAKTGSSDPTLTNLMDSKMKWMQENNITGYLTA